jgi:Fusaric acid resistance protein-like
MTEANSDVDSAGVPGQPSRARRMILILGAALVGVVLPVVLLYVFLGNLGSRAMVIGLLAGVLGSKLGGTRRMLYLAPAVGVAGGIGAITAYHWSWVVLLAVVGVIAGAGMLFGWLPSLLMLTFAATFPIATSSAKDAAAYGAIAAIATLYGIVLARRFQAPEVVERQRVSLPVAIGVAAVFGIALAGAGAIGVALGWTEPYWVPEPVVLLVLYVLIGKRERIREKAVGTALGAFAVVPVAIAALPAWAVYALAGVAFVLAIWQYKKYWLYYAFYTFGLILVISPPGQVGSEAAHRGSEILIGIGILAVGLAILQPLSTWQSERYPEPELADSDESPEPAEQSSPSSRQAGLASGD